VIAIDMAATVLDRPVKCRGRSPGGGAQRYVVGALAPGVPSKPTLPMSV
jgi:hypothetical protein